MQEALAGTAVSMGTAESTTWTNWGLAFSTLHLFLYLQKAVIQKISIYCITILLHAEADNNPSSIWMRAEGHQLFDSYPMLSAGCSIPLAVCSLCTARMGKTGFFQQSKIRLLWKSFHSSRQGRQQSWKREGVGSRKKDPSNISSWRKRPSSFSGQDKACKENKGKNKSTELKLPTWRITALLSECLLLPTNHIAAEDFPSQADGSSFQSPAGMVL